MFTVRKIIFNLKNKAKIHPAPKLNFRSAMFDRLTMKQNEADDLILFIRKANQKRAETESQIKKIKKELQNVEAEKIKEHDIRSVRINTLKAEINQVSFYVIYRDATVGPKIFASKKSQKSTHAKNRIGRNINIIFYIIIKNHVALR